MLMLMNGYYDDDCDEDDADGDGDDDDKEEKSSRVGHCNLLWANTACTLHRS